MSALPYMPLYVADYLADTAHLSALENGAYLMLIMNYWQRGKALPSDPAQLARICRLTGKQWGKVKTPLGNFFEQRDGLWIHHRIETELAKVRDKSTKASNAGKASAQQKLNARSTDVQQTFNHTDTDTDTEKEISRKTRSRVSYPSRYEDFWKAYPTDPGMSKTEAFREWERLSEEDREEAFSALSGFRTWVSKQGKDYRIVHAVRYLKHRRFEGFAPATNGHAITVKQVPVEVDTPAWKAWNARRKYPVTDLHIGPGQVKRGWYFPTEYPPQQESAA